MGAGVLRDQVGVGAEAIAGAFDVDDDGVVEQAVEERGGDDGIAEDVAPFGEAAIGREDHGALFVTGVDELEEQVGAARGDGEVTDLVDDQQTAVVEVADFLGEASLAFGAAQHFDQLGEGAAVDPATGLDGGDAEGGGEMALSGPGRAKEVDDLGAHEEVELGERQDAVAIEGGLEGEVEALQGLGRGEARGLEGDGDAPVLAGCVFLGEQAVDGLQRRDLALFHAPERVVEGLEGTGHAQADQAGPDALEDGGHDAPPSAASRRPTAS